jgi:RNA polymerase sigma-70 factor, ECF subfamily
LIAELEELYRKLQPGLYRYCLFLVKNEEDALELVNDTFMAIWEKRDKLALDENLKAYMYISARNKCFNHLKKKRMKFQDLASSDQMPNNLPDPVQIINSKETEALLYRLIDQLPERCKQVFLLSRNEGLSYKEIAEIMDISPKTVENQIGIALKNIRWGLARYEKKQGSAKTQICLLLFTSEIIFNIHWG